MNIHAALALILVATAALLPHRARADGAPTDGLIHQWHFDETSGTTADDSIGAANFTLQNGASFDSSGLLGGSVRFDGVDDVLQAAGLESGFFRSPFTVSLWTLFTPSPNKLGLLSIISGVSVRLDVDLGFGDPKPVLLAQGYTGKTQKVVSIGDGQWHLISLVNQYGAIFLYVDGVQSQYTNGIFYQGGSTAFQLGKQDTDHFFSGRIDEVSIYNRALSPAEIAQAAAVPEPETTLLLAAALGSLWLRRRSPDFHQEGAKAREG